MYCGEVRETTDEHVVPKGLYSKDHRVVIPCCEPCNNAKARDDEYFRLVFAALLESKGHPVAQQVLEKVKRSLQNPNQARYREMIVRSANNIEVCDSAGDTVKRTGLDVEINRVNKTLEFITRALLYLETGAYLPEDYTVVSTFGKEEDTEAGSDILNRIRATLADTRWKEVGEDEVFKYRYAIIEDAPRTVWEMEIYRGVRIVTIVSKTSPPESKKNT